MICYLCKKEHVAVCSCCHRAVNRGDDNTTLNCYSRCRNCQRAIDIPRPWRRTSNTGHISYGCYFPTSDLNIDEMGSRGTGCPRDVEWLIAEGFVRQRQCSTCEGGGTWGPDGALCQPYQGKGFELVRS